MKEYRDPRSVLRYRIPTELAARAMLMNERWTPERQDEMSERAHIRGPLRPEQLLSVRKRNAIHLRSHTFRAVDLFLIAAATVVTVERGYGAGLLRTTIAQVAPFVAGSYVLARCLRSMGLYSFGRTERSLIHLGRVAAAAGVAFGVAVGVDTIAGSGGPAVRSVAMWAGRCVIGVVVLHVVWGQWVRHWRRTGWLTPNVVVVGATAHAEELIRTTLQRRDLNLLGIFDDRLERSPMALLGVPVLGNIDALNNHKITPYVDLIVVAVDTSATARIRQITGQLAVLPNRVSLIVDNDGDPMRAGTIEQLVNAPLASLNFAVDSERRAFAKRLQDLSISVPMMILMAPLFGVIALAVRLDSPGPIFFRQRRHGFNNEEIVVWKFRTMRREATDATAERQVSANDERVTRVGRLLRKSSLDELPQLFNVISGEMSLVGPRPHAIGMKTGEVESARLVAEYAHRHRIKPGMTGWAAVKGSRGPLNDAAAVRRRVALDVQYIDRQSFWVDLWIMLRTVPSIFGDRCSVR